MSVPSSNRRSCSLPPEILSDNNLWLEIADQFHAKKVMIILHGTPFAGKKSLSTELGKKLEVQVYHESFDVTNKVCVINTHMLPKNFLSFTQYSNHLVILVYSPFKLLVERFFQQKENKDGKVLGNIFKSFCELYGPATSGGMIIGEISTSNIEWINDEMRDSKLEDSVYAKSEWIKLKCYFGFNVEEVLIQLKYPDTNIVQTQQPIEDFLKDMQRMVGDFCFGNRDGFFSSGIP